MHCIALNNTQCSKLDLLRLTQRQQERESNFMDNPGAVENRKEHTITLDLLNSNEENSIPLQYVQHPEPYKPLT